MASDQRGSQSTFEENLFSKSPFSIYNGTYIATQKDNEPVQPPIKDEVEEDCDVTLK